MKFWKDVYAKLKKELKSFSSGVSTYELQRTNGAECAAVLLSDVKHSDHYFYLNNNIPIKNLCELSDHLREIDEGSFRNHVNNERNDFGEWVSNTIGDKTLGKKLSELDDKEEISKAVDIRVDYIKRRANLRY